MRTRFLAISMPTLQTVSCQGTRSTPALFDCRRPHPRRSSGPFLSGHVFFPLGMQVPQERSRGRASRQIWGDFSNRSRRWAGKPIVDLSAPVKQATPRVARADRRKRVGARQACSMAASVCQGEHSSTVPQNATGLVGLLQVDAVRFNRRQATKGCEWMRFYSPSARRYSWVRGMMWSL